MLKATIHRGRNQIGGNVVEISTQASSILFDAGRELDEGESPSPPAKGLFTDIGRDGVFISHYHLDHFGLAEHIETDTPVYMGSRAYSIARASELYKNNRELSFNYRPIEAGRKIFVGDIAVTPYLADHSAFDSYMFLAEANGEKILYTGDFRAHGRKTFYSLLRVLPVVDTLICEGTTLNRGEYRNKSERELEEMLVSTFRETSGPIFVLQSAMNIDRLVTAYRAAKRSGRLFLQDLYTARIAGSAVNARIPNPSFKDVRVFVPRFYPRGHFRYAAFSGYGDKRISLRGIAGWKFVMCVRSSMLGYLRRLAELMDFSGGLLVYSIWDGHRQKPDMKKFLDNCSNLGLKIIPGHTSGHADAVAIEKLIERVRPSTIIPIHTENAAWFKNRFEEVAIR
jgi:ribonuclease J